jgi:methanogenic corrinoid protein MtbC1
LIAKAREEGADFALLSRDVIEPALEQIGAMWSRGELSVAEEHLATALISRAVGVLAAKVDSPNPGAPRILFTCLAGEFHELGVRIVSEVARECGWDAENLGGNVPREALLRFLVERTPQAVGLSLSLTGHIVEAAKTIEEIRKACPGIKVLAGGRIFREDPALAACVGADAATPDVVELRDWLKENREKLGCARGGLESARPPAEHPETLPDSFRQRLRQPN